jgi:hypothetical protein
MPLPNNYRQATTVIAKGQSQLMFLLAKSVPQKTCTKIHACLLCWEQGKKA